MASQDRGSFFDLKLDLLKDGHAFSFFQVVRLLRFFREPSNDNQKTHSDDTDHIRMRPKLSLAFPPADIDRVEELNDGENDEARRFLVTANLLGLYGSSSPLPTFYTEDLMEEASVEESVTRDFIDIINHRLLLLLFKCWTKYRQFLQVVEEKNTDHLVRLFSLLGLGEKALREDVPDAEALIKYIGLLTQFPRSALGLKRLLQDALGEVSISVVPCVERKASIPLDQRLYLGKSGGVLGDDSFVGQEVEDRMGKFRLKIGPLTRQQFQLLLPGGADCEKLSFLTRFYVAEALEYDVELTLAEQEAQSVCLGHHEWSRLGWDTWIFSGEQMAEANVRFCPEECVAGSSPGLL